MDEEDEVPVEITQDPKGNASSLVHVEEQVLEEEELLALLFCFFVMFTLVGISIHTLIGSL